MLVALLQLNMSIAVLMKTFSVPTPAPAAGAVQCSDNSRVHVSVVGQGGWSYLGVCCCL